MLLLFAHGLTAVRGGARDCVGVWPDTDDGMRQAMEHAEVVEGAHGRPVTEEWCAIYRAEVGKRLCLLVVREYDGWVDRQKQQWPIQPFAD